MIGFINGDAKRMDEARVLVGQCRKRANINNQYWVP